MFNTYVMKVGYVLLIVINLAVPCLKGTHSRLWLLQIAACLVWILGLLGGLGFLNPERYLLLWLSEIDRKSVV